MDQLGWHNCMHKKNMVEMEFNIFHFSPFFRSISISPLSLPLTKPPNKLRGLGERLSFYPNRERSIQQSGDSMNKSKRRKASIHEDGVDRISNLPDHVLLLILSGLPFTKESIRTSILSRRWRYTWTSIPSLDLKLEYRKGRNRSEEKSKFKNIVDRALLHRSVDLDSFRLYGWNHFSRSTLERWIHATVMRNVKDLDLTFWPRKESESEDIVIPHCLVTCASLEVLKLCLGRRLIVPSSSGFPALKVLKLEYVELFDDGLVKYFLESCPLLEDLTLDDCSVDKLDLLCISSPNLKKLSFLYEQNEDLCGCLKLFCSKLVFLQITGEVASNYIFEGPCSLKEAVIYPDYDGISRLFHIISHVESLRTELYYLDEYIDDARDPALPNLKTLELTAVNDKYNDERLKQIFKICPSLESLCLTIDYVCIDEDSIEDYDDETEYPKLNEVGTSILPRDVAWVEFFEFNGEKPNLTVKLYDNDKSKLENVVAKWGNKAMFSH